VPKPEYEFFDPVVIPWQAVAGGPPGLSERILSRDQDSGDYTRQLRFDPGSDTSPMGVQRHDFWEEVWILEGAFHDLELDKTFTKGMYACRPPGMPHGPWRSPEGCVTFEIRYHKK
jgi:ChrR Cupin-like domain